MSLIAQSKRIEEVIAFKNRRFLARKYTKPVEAAVTEHCGSSLDVYETKTKFKTQQMKDKWGIKNKPLADFMPTILLKAKDFATEITIFNAKQKQMKTEGQISNEHITNNKTVRNTLISRGIFPENLPPEEDVKKIERKLKSEEVKSLKENKGFKNNNEE